MQQEIPLYIFIRNSAILCFAFFIISSVIIERGRQERGENSLINNTRIKNRDSNVSENIGHSKSQEFNSTLEYSNFSIYTDSISNPSNSSSFSSNFVNNRNQSFEISNQVDL